MKSRKDPLVKGVTCDEIEYAELGGTGRTHLGVSKWVGQLE